MKARESIIIRAMNCVLREAKERACSGCGRFRRFEMEAGVVTRKAKVVGQALTEE